MAESTVSFAHGKKSGVASAITAGKIDEDDFIVFSDTDDEIAFVSHDKTVKPIKARTNEAYTLNGTSVGALEDGDTIPAGTSIDDFIKMIVEKPVHPTYILPTISLKTSNTNYNQEVGTTIDTSFTATYNQNDGGNLESISVCGVDSIVSPLTVPHTFEVAEGSNKFTATASYAAGPIKTNNLGQEDAEGSIAAGTITSAAITYTGKYKYFYGTTNEAPTLDTLSSTLGVSNGTTITINVPTGAKIISFAYPSSLRKVSKVEYIEMNDSGMAENFNLETVDYTLPNGSIKQYNLYTYEMAVEAAATMTIKATI